MCDPTHDFPGLDASVWYQDGYPLLLLSEESVKAAEIETRKYVGVQGVEEKWANDDLVIERYVFRKFSAELRPLLNLGAVGSDRTLS